jgi:type IV pilus assembly protein PilP
MMGVHDMMRNPAKLCIVMIFVMALTGLFSCSEDTPPAPQPQVVKKKIGQQKPNVQSVEAAAKPLEAQSKDGMVSTDKPAGETEGKTPTASKLVEESMAFAGSYDPKGRFDPFEPLFKSEPDAKPISTKSGRKKGRIPQTPLERVALSQLKLSAIMRTTKGNSAIVEDATGKGYVIRKGTYIGLNSGQVVKIEKDRVMIEEESEDISGEFRIQNTELKLQKPAGEL